MRMAANWFDYDITTAFFLKTTFICKTKIPHAMIKEFHSCEDNSNEETDQNRSNGALFHSTWQLASYYSSHWHI